MKYLLKMLLIIGLVFGSMQVQSNPQLTQKIVTATLKSIQRKKGACPPAIAQLRLAPGTLKTKIKNFPPSVKAFIFEALIVDYLLNEQIKDSFATCVDTLMHFISIANIETNSCLAHVISQLQKIKHTTSGNEICKMMKSQFSSVERSVNQSTTPAERRITQQLKANIEAAIKQKGGSIKLLNIIKLRASLNKG